MDRKYASNEQALAVAKEAVWLAWNASGVSGMGAFQDRGPNQDREKVWDHAYNQRDYYGRQTSDTKSINCDYVMGRMMKLSFAVDGDTLKGISESKPRGDYQSWCYQYKTYGALFDAAESVALKKEAA